MSRIVIAGAGLAGPLLAILFARRGMHVELFERRSDPRRAGLIGGRSINLALSIRGITALRRAGLDAVVLRDALPMRGRMIHAPDSSLAFQPYSKNPGDAINSVSRARLNLSLIEAAAALPNLVMHFDCACTDLDIERNEAIFTDTTTGATRRAAPDLVVGADRAYSAIRQRLQKQERFNFRQDYLEYGYKELTIPPTSSGEFALDPAALHIWPRGGFMMIALPNADRSFTCTCFWPLSGPDGFDQLTTDEGVLERFRRNFADAVPLMPTLARDYRANPTSALVTIRCMPWHSGGRVALIGDAAHAIVPFFGQGMNAAFEDCAALDDLCQRHGTDWSKILPEYTAQRKRHADAIADLALENFIEMRDKVGSRAFRAKKKWEKLIHRLLPGWYQPLYNLISFSTVPYDDARRLAASQARVIRAVLIVIAALIALLLITLIF